MEKKISKLGLWLVVIHSVIVITIGYRDSLNFSGGFGLTAILVMDIPASLLIVFLSDFIDNICKIPPYILTPALSVIFGGLQWYYIGWTISRLKRRFFTSFK